METQCSKKWRSKLTRLSKLVLYEALKKNYEVEHYLEVVSNFEHRSNLTKSRISKHKLTIEKGRYRRQKLIKEDRTCKCCNDNSIESEIHFIYNCPFNENLRNQFSKEIDVRSSCCKKVESRCRMLETTSHRVLRVLTL